MMRHPSRVRARVASPLRRWLRLAWLDRLPQLAAWLTERLRTRTADDRREPRRPFRPELMQLETRFIPNDILSLLTAGPLLGAALPLAGGFTTPALALLRGWGGSLAPDPLPPAPAAATPRPTAAADAVFTGAPATWRPAPAGADATTPVAATPSDSATNPTAPAGDGTANPFSTAWLSAIDDVFGTSAGQHPAGSLAPNAARGEGGGGGASGAIVPDLGVQRLASAGTGSAPAAPQAPTPQSLAAAGMLSATPTSATPAGLSAGTPAVGIAALAPATDVSGGGNTGFGSGTTAPALPQAQAAFGRIPLAFEANVGQTSSAVSFLSHGPGFSLFLSGASATFALPVTSGQDAGTATNVLKLDFVGGNPDATLSGQGQLPSTSNYFSGLDGTPLFDYVPNFSQVVVHNVYPGIDVAFFGTDSRTLEYDFILHPGASPSAIDLNWEGVTGLSTDAQGNLDLATGAGTVVENAPAVYQTAATADTASGDAQAVAGIAASSPSSTPPAPASSTPPTSTAWAAPACSRWPPTRPATPTLRGSTRRAWASSSRSAPPAASSPTRLSSASPGRTPSACPALSWTRCQGALKTGSPALPVK